MNDKKRRIISNAPRRSHAAIAAAFAFSNNIAEIVSYNEPPSMLEPFNFPLGIKCSRGKGKKQKRDWE